jgi:hypothetical protein
VLSFILPERRAWWMSPRSLKPVEFAGIPHIWAFVMCDVVAGTTLV